MTNKNQKKVILRIGNRKLNRQLKDQKKKRIIEKRKKLQKMSCLSIAENSNKKSPIKTGKNHPDWVLQNLA